MNRWIVPSKCKDVTKQSPLRKLSDLFSSAPAALRNDSGRLWLEDFMMLRPEEEVILLITKNHPILMDKGKREAACVGLNRNKVESIICRNPIQPLQIGRSVYFAMRMKVRSNVHLNDFKAKNLTASEYVNLIKVETGAGLTFETDALSELKGEHTLTFTLFFLSLLDRPLDLMVWKDKHQGGSRISMMKDLLDRYSDHFKAAATVDTYKDFVHGDSMQVYVIYSHLQVWVAKKEHKAEFKNYKNSQISDQRLKQHIHLMSSDENLKEFKTYVDGICKKLIDNLYGRFSTFATPILNQCILTTFVNQFKLIMPRQYKMIISMIGKDCWTVLWIHGTFV